MTARKLYSFRPMLGPPEDVPAGTPEWAERISNRLQAVSKDVSRSSAHYIKDVILKICASPKPPWEIFPEGEPFGTPDIYSSAITGHSWSVLCAMVVEFTGNDDLLRIALAKAQAKVRTQGTRTDLLLSNRKKLSGGGTNQEYLLRRLARLANKGSDVLDRYERGEFKSVRKAAIEAGIVKVPTALQLLRTAWKKASEEEKMKFLKEIKNGN